MIICMIMISCGNESPILDGKTPFVVVEVKKYSDTHSEYYGRFNGGEGAKYNFLGSWYPMIVLPTGYYNVGDTITICDPASKSE